MKSERFDFIVIGSGFAGSIMSMILRRLGKSVLLLERGTHPRFVIGESSTPFANLLLEHLADAYDLGFLKSLSEWGQWQQTFPGLPVGLKRGFTFYHHTFSRALDFNDRSQQLLVAASPNDRVADTHWYRPGFDEFLVRQAQSVGVDYRDEAGISGVENDGRDWTMTVLSRDTATHVTAPFLIDASGASGFSPLNIEKATFPKMPPTRSIYAHFRNVTRVDEDTPGLREAAPYPPDDSAVHHLFPGGWIWVLRFNNGITSAGAAFVSDRFDPDESPEKIWHSVLRQLPAVERLFEGAAAVTPFHSVPQLSFRRTKVAGRNWALLPSAAGFVDPLLSTGFALSLLGLTRLAAAFGSAEPDLRAYETDTFLELDATADLVSALYAKLHSPDEFAALSLLYFAAMSFSETAWRLRKRDLASSFLLTNNPEFSAARARFCEIARHGGTIGLEAVRPAIEPYDLAGLTDRARHPWYPVVLDDLRNRSGKLGASPAEIESLFRKLGVAGA